ncbi:hypothetical protein ECF1_0188 [Enterobacter phage EC-F1]|uniref:Uncharacterized protein n=1 Tax=Cronobacter phage vB_CsaM_SemperBestia TaxID=2777353 RepID=A0A7T3NB58_9CAUD|nr:hypothetical protein [Cronobacter phage vB_CsaM_SemperBestia]UGV22940.1 hypothetical protein INVICTA_173 [Cronobacter phage vB_CsaM_Invicta]URP86138.1 hypothetical protein ECF1_0188 [Enterobacter phage EC-F1]WAW44678.1 hypothetical protein [Klebsiella phage Kp_GWPR59]WOL25272.1 hypothetical protein iPHageKPN12i_00205 [Klebsiella phage iPHaGe-KPN-12i]
MKIYTVESLSEDYYTFSDLVGSTVSLERAIEMAKSFDWVSITECDGFTGERLRIVTLNNEKAIANATKENLQFEDVK